MSAYKLILIIILSFIFVFGINYFNKPESTVEYWFGNPSALKLSNAAANGEGEEIIDLNEKTNSNYLDYQGKKGITPLIWSLLNNNKKDYMTLLSLGADPNIQMNDGKSVMYYSLYQTNSFYLREALNHGGNPNLINKKNKLEPTPIFTAIMLLDFEKINLLIDAGADVDFLAANNYTPLLSAADLNRWDIVLTLLKHGANYRIKDDSGKTILFNIEHNSIDKNNMLYKWRSKVIDFLNARGIKVKSKVS